MTEYPHLDILGIRRKAESRLPKIIVEMFIDKVRSELRVASHSLPFPNTMLSLFQPFSIGPLRLHFNAVLGKSHQPNIWGSLSVHKATLYPQLCWIFLQLIHSSMLKPPGPHIQLHWLKLQAGAFQLALAISLYLSPSDPLFLLLTPILHLSFGATHLPSQQTCPTVYLSTPIQLPPLE